jgi:hypothetical protein
MYTRAFEEADGTELPTVLLVMDGTEKATPHGVLGSMLQKKRMEKLSRINAEAGRI